MLTRLSRTSIMLGILINWILNIMLKLGILGLILLSSVFLLQILV